MKRFSFCCVALLAGATIVMPLVSAATPRPRDDRGVYDREHKHDHKWDHHENCAWHRWLADHHRKNHEFLKADRKEQGQYWKWRHGIPTRTNLG